jgi:hypothetical protein
VLVYAGLGNRQELSWHNSLSCYPTHSAPNAGWAGHRVGRIQGPDR